jgi:integrase
MPFVVRHPTGRSPYWYAVYRDATGRRLKKSTKLTSKSKALEMAHTLQRAANEARRGVLTETRTRELLSEILQSVNGEGLRMFTVADWLAHFVGLKQKSRTGKTAARHEQTMREFVEFLGYRSRLNIATVTSKDVADFRDHRESLGLAPSTLNCDVRILSSAFSAALKQGHIAVNPCSAIEEVKDKVTARKETFTPDQVTALVKAAGTEDWKGLILVGFYCGARIADCANLQWKQVSLTPELKTIRFHQGKTGGEVVTVIHPVLVEFLTSMRRRRKVIALAPQSDESYVFPSLAQRRTSRLSTHFREVMDRAHITSRVIRERRTKAGRTVSAQTFHSLRYTFNSILANAGVPEAMIMELAGHATRALNRHYTRRELSTYQAAIAVLPRV